MDRLDKLESQSIYIIREAHYHYKKPALLWSIGKDSTTLLWLCRKAFLGSIPFLGALFRSRTTDKVKTNLMSPNGEPTMFFFEDLVRTIMEIEGYMYMDKGDDKGKPQDKDDHFCENLYRLCLLNTQYIPPEEEYEEEWEDDKPAGRYTV